MATQIVVVEGEEGEEGNIGMRVQRRVRMGNYGKLGSPYILDFTLGHMMFVYIYLVTFLPYESIT